MKELLSKHKYIIYGFISALFPPLWCVLRAFSNGHSFFDVWFCGSNWQDELFYYQLTGGVVNNGVPQGYFGYNEGHARFLSFGTWSPLLLIYWALWGLIFGWNILSPVLANLFLASLGLFLFVIIVKPQKENIAIMLVLLSFLTPFSRFIMSCMPEVPSAFTMLMAMALWFSCRDEYKAPKMTVSYIFFVLAVLMRPYFIVFMLIPFLYEIRRGKRKWFIPILVSVFALILYVVETALWSSPYFFSAVRSDWITTFFTSGFKAGIGHLVETITDFSAQIMAEFWPGLRYGRGGSAYYGVFMAFIVIWLVLAVIDSIYKRNDLVFSLSYLLLSLGMLMAIILMYQIGEGSKHLFIFILLGVMNVSMRQFNRSTVISSLIITLMFTFVFIYKGTSNYHYHVTYKSDGYDYVEDISRQLEGKMQLSKGINWDNTVIWVSADYIEETDEYSETLWRMLYALPPGYGLNICSAEYVNLNIDSLKSGYIATVPGGTVEKNLLAGNPREVARNEYFVMYDIRK